jgi:putative SOS response-associated peptidase YedK
MCGRVALYSPPARLARLVEATVAAGLSPGDPHYNVGPQQTLFAATEEDGRILDAFRWGLLPAWATDPAMSNRLFNARAETVAEKPSFRAAFAKRPCLIPVDGFFEWDQRNRTVRQPHYFLRRDGEPLVLAGLYETWTHPDTGAHVATCTVITTTPNGNMDDLHDRMPVILESDEYDLWLDGTADPAQRLALLDPAPEGTLTHYGVDRAVGNVRHDGPHLLDRHEVATLF